MQFNKPAITIAEQIQLLESRGLIIEDRIMVEHYLSQISYYRLAGYWWPLQVDKEAHIFKPDSTFQTVIDIYNFDRELRLIVFNMIERIEISIRTQLIYQLSLGQSPWWFENSGLFKSPRHWQENLKSLDKELRRSKEVFMQEHLRKYYSDGRRPPAWKSFEIISLGLLSKFYADLKNNLLQKKKIAKKLHVGNHTYLTSWLRSLTVIRNICAHHSRLWNRNLPTPPKLLSRAPLPWIEKPDMVDVHSFYAVFICLYYLLQTVSPKNQFKHRFKGLLEKYPNIDTRAMGFPDNWETEPLWQG
jgi:abortive infection bacteriophage resistance protein